MFVHLNLQHKDMICVSRNYHEYKIICIGNAYFRKTGSFLLGNKKIADSGLEVAIFLVKKPILFFQITQYCFCFIVK